MNKVLALVLAVVVVGFSAFIALSPSKEVETDGASRDNTSLAVFHAGLVEGGMISTSTTAGVTNIPARFLSSEKLISVLPTGAVTLTLPASTSLSGVIPRPGMSQSFIVLNRSTTTTNTITFAGNTGVLLKRATTSSVFNGDPDGGSLAELRITRLLNGNITASVEIFTD